MYPKIAVNLILISTEMTNHEAKDSVLYSFSLYFLPSFMFYNQTWFLLKLPLVTSCLQLHFEIPNPWFRHNIKSISKYLQFTVVMTLISFTCNKGHFVIPLRHLIGKYLS